MMDPYAVLGIPRTATAAEIKRAFRMAAKAWHPDRFPDDRGYAAERMKDLNAAWRILGDPKRRVEYDRERVVDRIVDHFGHAHAPQAPHRSHAPRRPNPVTVTVTTAPQPGQPLPPEVERFVTELAGRFLRNLFGSRTGLGPHRLWYR